MNIDWAALGQVFGISLLATVVLVGIFTLGILGSSAVAKEAGGSTVLARSGAYVCFALCAAAVAYGIYIISS